MAMPLLKQKIATVDCPMCLTANPETEKVCQECGTSLPASKSTVPVVLSTTMLGCTEGSSNKQYLVTVEERGDDYIVFAEYGPRGRLCQHAEKARSKNLGIANTKAFRLINSKLARGYVIESQTGNGV